METNPKILIVDDKMENLFTLHKLLQELARQAVEAWLMDIMMLDMDAYAPPRQISSQQRFRRLPILALTTKVMQGDRRKCLAAGAHDYLSKPVNPDRLFSLFRTWRL